MAGLFDMEAMKQDYAQRKMAKEQEVGGRMIAPIQEALTNPYEEGTVEYAARRRKMMQIAEEARMAQEQAQIEAEIEARYAAKEEPGFFSGLFGS